MGWYDADSQKSRNSQKINIINSCLIINPKLNQKPNNTTLLKISRLALAALGRCGGRATKWSNGVGEGAEAGKAARRGEKRRGEGVAEGSEMLGCRGGRGGLGRGG